MSLGPVESLFLLIAGISLLGPLMAAAYLAVRLNRRRPQALWHDEGTSG